MFSISRFFKISGVTLVEVLITISIISILAVIAVTNFGDLIVRNKLNSMFNTMMSTLQYARSESIKLRNTVTICPSTDGLGCNNSGRWEDGWIVFHDRNGNGVVDKNITLNDVVLRKWPAITGRLFNIGIGGSIMTQNIVRYDPRGRAVETGFFIFCHDNQLAGARVIEISTLHIRRALDKNEDGVPEINSNTNYQTCSPT